MNVLVSNLGDDSIALIQWAYDDKLSDCYVVYVHTGFEAYHWQERINKAATWVQSLGFTFVPITPEHTLIDMMKARNRFPSKKFQWCSSFIKGLPLLDWLDKHDEDGQAVILLANRRSMSYVQAKLPETEEESEFYGERAVWYPLVTYTQSQRDELIKKTPFEIRYQRSLECQPCIHSTLYDLAQLSESEIQRVEHLEHRLSAPFFHPEDHENAYGIREVVERARQKVSEDPQKTWNNQWHEQYRSFAMSCSWSFGCGL